MMAAAKRKKAPKKKAPASPKADPRSKTKTRKKPKPKKSNGMCFVLMPFRAPYDTYFEVILRPAVLDANLTVTRADSLFASTPIMGDIWKLIQQAEVLLAVLTGKNPNVFYELGLGHAIGKPIVLVSETLDDVPFDLQALRVRKYDKDDPEWGPRLQKDITTALLETLSSTVENVPPMFRKPVKSQAPEDTATNMRLEAVENRLDALSSSIASARFGGMMVASSVFEDVRPVRLYDPAQTIFSGMKDTQPAPKSVFDAAGPVSSDVFPDEGIVP